MVTLFHLLMCVVDAVALSVGRRSPRHLTQALGTWSIGFLAVGWALVAAMAGSLFFLLRLLDLALFVHLPLLGGIWAWSWRKHRPRLAAGVGLIGLATIGLGVYSHWIEPRWLEVRTVRIETDELTAPVRIVVLADLQTDRVGGWERRVFERVRDEQPDLALLPGDYLQVYGEGRLEEARSRLQQLLREVDLAAPMGIFAVRGDMEGPGWQSYFAGSRVLPVEGRDERSLGEVQLTLLAIEESADSELVVSPREGFHIVVGHRPDFALGEVDADLLVAGHTHGGQVRLPWIGPLLTFSAVPREWAAGMTTLGRGRRLLVSRGVGMERGWAPRVRFLCRPELVVVDLVPKRSPERTVGSE